VTCGVCPSFGNQQAHLAGFASESIVDTEPYRGSEFVLSADPSYSVSGGIRGLKSLKTPFSIGFGYVTEKTRAYSLAS